MKRIFVSSVQKEFERERAAIKRMIESDPILKPHFKAFVFEIDAPAVDKTTQQVYLKEIEKSDIYLVLIGNKYGYCDESGVSPTEQEFDRAKELGLTTLVMVRGRDDSKREEQEARFLKKVSDGRVRVRYQDSEPEQAVADLLDEVRNSLREIMLDDGILSETPFEDQCLDGVSLDEIDANRVAWFAERAVRVRKAKYSANPSVEDVLRSLHLFDAKRKAPTKAGVLLFGRDVQGPFPSSAVKCVCYSGTEKRKPSIDMELVEGDLFQLADQTVAFVNRHLNHGVGEHRHGAAADDVDEIPNSVIAEAVNNAIAHRNYASAGSIQVEVYSDRIEVISPGRLHRAISVPELYKKHESYAPNPRIARAMYQVKYIETLGTGLTDLLAECKAKGLKRPLFEEVSGRFRVIIWRPEVRDNRGDNRGDNPVATLPEEQRRICEMMIENPKIAVRKIASTLGIRPRTVEKQIAALKAKGILVRKGGTRGSWLVVSR